MDRCVADRPTAAAEEEPFADGGGTRASEDTTQQMLDDMRKGKFRSATACARWYEVNGRTFRHNWRLQRHGHVRSGSGATPVLCAEDELVLVAWVEWLVHRVLAIPVDRLRVTAVVWF